MEIVKPEAEFRALLNDFMNNHKLAWDDFREVTQLIMKAYKLGSEAAIENARAAIKASDPTEELRNVIDNRGGESGS
jgi:hypothetical protein